MSRIKTAIKQHPRLYRLALKTAFWWEQTLARPLRQWPFLPGELSRYFGSLRRYRTLLGAEALDLRPVLFQNRHLGFDAQYTYQAAWAAGRIRQVNPALHVDISSDLRFVTQLTALTQVIYIEYRATRLALPGLHSLQADALRLPFADGSLQSLSCLHVIEHIGLGRYGDALNPLGSQQALAEFVRALRPGGSLFLSTPVGRPRTQFNAHRIFDPESILKCCPGMRLREFCAVDTAGNYLESISPAAMKNEEYACGLYWLEKEVNHDVH